jgi:cytochrome c5
MSAVYKTKRLFLMMMCVSVYMILQTNDVNAADGREIYNTYCTMCHQTGLNAAPMYGNKQVWKKIIITGRETVYSYAINGLRGMPARGGNASLSDDEVKAAVDFMVGGSGGWGDTK